MKKIAFNAKIVFEMNRDTFPATLEECRQTLISGYYEIELVMPFGTEDTVVIIKDKR